MSWMKRRGHTNPNPAPGPPVQIYNPNQHSNQESQWQSALNTPSSNWYNQTPQNQQKQQFGYDPSQQQANYWQPYNQQQYKQNVTNQYQTQYTEAQNVPQQPNYYSNNEFPQQNIANDQYSQQSQPYDFQTQNSAYGQQSLKTESDSSWNWGWGDEDNSNIQPQGAQNSNTTQASNISDSFTNEESWNWSVEEANSMASSQNLPKAEHVSATTSHTSLDSLPIQQTIAQADQTFPKIGKLAEKHSKTPNTENYTDHSIKRGGKIDHLTPQWSIESQLSQESSDDILQTSESDKMLSRSSTISQSPISGHDVEILPQIQEGHTQDVVRHEIPGNFEQDTFLRQHENKENLSGSKPEVSQEVNLKNDPTPPLLPPPSANQTPPLPLKNHTPPLVPLQSSLDDARNPYKRTTAVSHKAASKFRAPTETKSHNFYQPPNFSQFTQSVNLETLPDNSEQPDPLPMVPTSQKLIKNPGHQLPDNNEVAPITERNQYLETGQLSDENTNQLLLQTENNDTLPPPGLRRMVLGQMESNDSDVNLQGSVDEPPPGISRIVLGQTESSSSLLPHNQPDPMGPPVGLHRMIPGESSSPEATTRVQYQSDRSRNEDYNSEVEMNQIISRITPLPQPRSATIGADTPPAVMIPIMGTNLNRSETIGADLKVENGRSMNQSVNSENRVGAVGVDSNISANLSQQNTENRRESIEGQPQDIEINSLVSGVRDLTVGTEGEAHSNDVQGNRRRSRQESTDSEKEIDRNKSPRDRKDRRYRDKEDRRDKPRDRYSPDVYRDKRYDRRRYRDNRYEEETDYYSDKERNRRRDERDKRGVDYDKKYSSLRKEKDKEKRRREPKDYERRERDGRSRGDFYYSRYEDDYDDLSRSRPSSRSDSLHESYRERVHDRDGRRYRDRERERDHHRRHRDPYSHYMQGFGYDPYNSYYQHYHYQYYENLRRTNPQAYAEWYRKYYQQAGALSTGNFGAEDRASVHSGRSSANDELKERYTRQNYYSHSSLPHVGGYYREPHSISGQYGMDESSYSRPFDATDSSLLFEDNNTQSQRLTPAKFAMAHVKASISSGQLVKILPHYPLDGQNATVEIINLQHVLTNDDEIKELLEFPGPLVKGVTHKKTIIEYCENKIRNACYNDDINDTESYILMWELMILLIRQNGMVVGTDIAELLMKDKNQEMNYRPPSVTSNTSSVVVETSEAQSSEADGLKEDFITNKFREYLLYGSGKEALEWAMKHGLWGHALFLASKLDKRTYANVMMRFANGLTMNDPLQTLYQLLSGRLPAAVTCVADEKWGDWRPHLAMILSNTTSRPELDRKAITTLADTLMSRGSVYAAHFCYLMAEVGFSRFGLDGAKLVLLGAVNTKPFEQFATNEAIHLTEVYEYACSLNDPAFVIPEFQSYKYLIATRLSDRGLLEKSLAYLEGVSIYIIQNPANVQPSLIDHVCKLADKLKYNDLVEDADESSALEEEGDGGKADNHWLKSLKIIQNDYNMGLITHESVSNLIDGAPEIEAYPEQQLYEHSQVQDSWQQQQIEQQYQQPWQNETLYNDGQDTQQKLSEQVHDGGYNSGLYQDQQYWNNQQQWMSPQTTLSNSDQYGQHTENQIEHQQLQQTNDYWNNAQTEPDEVEKQPDEDQPRPRISLPNQIDANEDIAKSKTTETKESPIKAKSKISKQQEKPATTGWFGGIWNRLALRPKNQMKLPDDKNPTIVWDPEKKKWVNLEEDGSEANAEVKPPPKMSEMGHKAPTGGQTSIPYGGGIPAQDPQYAANELVVPSVEEISKNVQPNMFKLQRARNIKKSYVDVFNPGGKNLGSAPSLLPAPESYNVNPAGATQMNFFIPAPVSDPNAPTDFLTPALVNTENQISRWSSTSSISKEVQYYMRQNPNPPASF